MTENRTLKITGGLTSYLTADRSDEWDNHIEWFLSAAEREGLGEVFHVRYPTYLGLNELTDSDTLGSGPEFASKVVRLLNYAIGHDFRLQGAYIISDAETGEVLYYIMSENNVISYVPAVNGFYSDDTLVTIMNGA